MTATKYSCDPWHKELIWIHTRRGFISILFINVLIFSFFNFHKYLKSIIYYDILKFEKISPNKTVITDSSLFENCTIVGNEACKNVTAVLDVEDVHDILDFKSSFYNFIVYYVFLIVCLWLLATVYRTSYEKTYFNALVHNCLVSYDLMENLNESKSDFFENNPRSSSVTKRFVIREEYGLHTFLRDDLVFGSSRRYDELKESFEDIMLKQQPLTGSNPYFLFIHVIEWIHDLLRAVKMMHKKKVYHLDLQPKKIYVHWLQSTMKTDYHAWVEDTSTRGCIKSVIRNLIDFDKYEYSDKRHVVLAEFSHVTRSENGEVQVNAIGVPEFYRPPECFNLQAVNAAKVDAWCIGIIAYELLTGGMLTTRASRYPPNTPCEEIISDTLNKEFISTAMHAHHHLLHCFLDIRFMQKKFRNYDLDQTVFATDCWTFVTGLLKSSPAERLSIQQALRHPLMKRVRKQTGKIYYINYPL